MTLRAGVAPRPGEHKGAAPCHDTTIRSRLDKRGAALSLAGSSCTANRTVLNRWSRLARRLAGDDAAGCFADEIAIDFPSVGDVVERMRRRFSASAGGRRAGTHLRVSTFARGTASPPLEVPMRGTARTAAAVADPA
jgi:hypothetical protein